MKAFLNKGIHAHLDLIAEIQSDKALQEKLEMLAESMIRVFEQGGRVLICGNGGSAADAAHLAAELAGRFYLDRPPLDAEALHVNDSFVTAVANDYGYDYIFERAVEAKGRKGDLLLAISTSGQSGNILKAVKKAAQIGLQTACFTGAKGNALAALCELPMVIPSVETPRIQEAYMLLGHLLCEWIEYKMFGNGKIGH